MQKVLSVTIMTAVLASNFNVEAQIKTALDGPVIEHFDGPSVPRTFFAFGGGVATYDESTSDLLVDRTGFDEHALTYVELADTMLSDVSIRIQAHLLRSDFTYPPNFDFDAGFGPAISIAVRTCFFDVEHVCGGEPDEWAYIDLYSNGDAYMDRNEASNRARKVSTALRPGEEDVIMQIDAFGTDVDFWAWPAGEPRPARPLTSFASRHEPTTAPGGVMFGTVHADALIRYVHISDSPIEDLLGDVNYDFRIDVEDIDLLSAEVRSVRPRPTPAFDLNGDNRVNAADRDLWIQTANTSFGDADLNGEVDFADFLVLSDNFGKDGGWARGDFDGSGDIQFADFLLLGDNFSGRVPTNSHSVPEPNASLMAAFCFCSFMTRRRPSHLIRHRRLFLLSAFIFSLTVSPASSQTIPIDDFQDGNDDGWFHIDFNVGDPWGPSIYTVEDGKYILETSGRIPFREYGAVAAGWDSSSDPMFSNGFLRLKINAGERGTYAAVGMRITGSIQQGFDGYWFGGDTEDGFTIEMFRDSINRNFSRGRGILDQDDYPFFADEDWYIEAGVVADRLSLKVWRPNEVEPEQPQITLRDRTLSEGQFSFITNVSLHDRPNQPQIYTTFSDVTFRLPIDCNADDSVDVSDTLCAYPESLGHILNAANLIQGDADGNGAVNFADFLVMSSNFGQEGDYQEGNFDLVNGIDFADFLILSSHFGESTAAAVPEPGVQPLILSGILFLGVRRTKYAYTVHKVTQK